ncbi:aromatic acid exporter family protein [Nocardioides sp. NPDC057577]|uniref:FUSC family protein n=1 Tax=unclassified Nocardioides TaxID=2615069 RepID=UPI00364658A2
MSGSTVATRRGAQAAAPVAGRAARLRAHVRRLPWGQALTAAVAGAIAFGVGAVFPGPAGEFPYYAPLGAVVAMSSTVLGSVRKSVQSILSIWLGSAIALAIGAVLSPGPVTVALVIGLGTIVGSWDRLDDTGHWVPTAALFVLIIGTGDPVAFVSAFGGLTLIGTAIGVAMTMLFPQLPLAPAERAMGDVRSEVLVQLRRLAHALQRDRPPTEDQWSEFLTQLVPTLQTMRAARQLVLDASRANVRREHHRDRLERQLEQAASLERVCLLVEELTQLLEEEERAENDQLGLGAELRPPTARALLALANLVESGDGRTADPEAKTEAQDALAELVDQIHDVRGGGSSDEDLFTAGSIVTTIRRCLETPRPVHR